MAFPIVAVAVFSGAALALPYILYGRSSYFPSDEPNSLDAPTLKSVNDTLMGVHQKLVEKGSEYSILKHVPFGKSCVEASEKRAAFIASLLSNQWEVLSCTVNIMTHTFNIVKFKNHIWIVDSYVIVYIKYVGTSLPADIIMTPQSRKYHGTAQKDIVTGTCAVIAPPICNTQRISITKDPNGRIRFDTSTSRSPGMPIMLRDHELPR